jgi:hypothetical protein
MSEDEASKRAEAEKDARNKWVGVFIGVLAVLLAICNVGGANATKDATHSNIAVSDTWAFYQAKNIRRTATMLAASELELMLAAQPGMPDEVRKKFEDKIKDYRAEVQRLTSDPTTKEGRDELMVRAQVAREGS